VRCRNAQPERDEHDARDGIECAAHAIASE
jgi:hypothetical protein